MSMTWPNRLLAKELVFKNLLRSFSDECRTTKAVIHLRCILLLRFRNEPHVRETKDWNSHRTQKTGLGTWRAMCLSLLHQLRAVWQQEKLSTHRASLIHLESWTNTSILATLLKCREDQVINAEEKCKVMTFIPRQDSLGKCTLKVGENIVSAIPCQKTSLVIMIVHHLSINSGQNYFTQYLK